ncbi:uncharacterized protein HD556DRAFT_1409841 [Suillus plorans]|uniref:SigF-like NTF2-like domain-containing protein n=1 Tax=Suillus plorans TaxID=116603 RepID=A0A9P7DCK5_9AGAM|nr:uncharacterized protein HD556DRAFT_1409841 [Suillus plorans]KAG1787376.1 hypothetical protein HD556DRAFT_1409841 [Suillus plorans]
MEIPQRDLPDVLIALTTSRSPADLRAAVNKFYMRNASLHHPFRVVEHDKNSRQKILSMYEWYRIISPDTTSNVDSVCYDKQRHVLVAEVTQHFRVRISPFKAAPSRYIMRIKLQERDKLFYIYDQEEFMHPTDLMNSVLPPLTPLVWLALVFFTFIGDVFAKAWVLSLIICVKLFGIGSDIQRGRVKSGLTRLVQPGDQETVDGVLKTAQYAPDRGNAKN